MKSLGNGLPYFYEISTGNFFVDNKRFQALEL